MTADRLNDATVDLNDGGEGAVSLQVFIPSCYMKSFNGPIPQWRDGRSTQSDHVEASLLADAVARINHSSLVGILAFGRGVKMPAIKK